jgi:arsenate reductase
MKLFHVLAERRARVLFVCFGNSCRSQAAEAFARALASDVIEPASAGILPGSRVSRTTAQILQTRGVAVAPEQKPKNITTLQLESFDLIVNFCEYAVPKTSAEVLKYELPDPYRRDEDTHAEVLREVERIVGFLAEHFRAAREWNRANPLYSEECARALSPA